MPKGAVLPKTMATQRKCHECLERHAAINGRKRRCIGYEKNYRLHNHSDGVRPAWAVSYTHLTLPTILLV